MVKNNPAPMSDSKGAAIREKLDEIFTALRIGEGRVRTSTNGLDEPPTQIFGMSEAEAKQAILAILAQEVKRVIGEDEKIDYSYVNIPEEWRANPTEVEKETRNNLRAEQRRKAGLV